MNKSKRLIFLLPAISALLLTMWSCNFLQTGRDKISGDENSWPVFRGNNTLTGYTGAKLPEQPALLWEYKSTTRTVSSPVVYNDIVYWSNRRGLIKGLDKDGNEVFSKDLDIAVEASLLLSDSIIYIGNMNGTMLALSLNSGNEIWRYETDGQISGSANISNIDGNKYILFGSYDYFFYCLNATTGELVSKFESDYYINGAASVSGWNIAYGGCDAKVRIVDIKAGTETRQVELDIYVPSSPVYDGENLYVGDYNGTIYRITGPDTVKLFNPAADNGSYIAMPAIDKKYIIFSSVDNKIYCLNKTDGHEVWSSLLGDYCESSPVIAGNNIVICGKNGKVFLLDAKNGEILWTYDTGEMISASPAVVSGRFYILTTKGTLFCFGEKQL